MSIRKSACAAALLGLVAASSWAGDYVIVVNKANANNVDRAMAGKIYTGDLKSWPDGGAVALVDLPESDALRAQFATEVAGKSMGSLKAQWAQLAFSGKALPPKVMDSDADVKKFVAGNKGAIGYIKAGSADDSVKTIK